MSADRDPNRQRVLNGTRKYRKVLDRRAVSAAPGDPLAFADLQEELELFFEELVVIRQVVAEQRERLRERAAARHDLGAAVRDEVEGREILEDTHRIVRADDADRARQADALGARGRGSEHDGRRGNNELPTVMIPKAVDVEAHFVGELDLVEEPPHPLVRADRSSGLRVGRRLPEAVHTELHASSTRMAWG